jgi:hypothetical protein
VSAAPVNEAGARRDRQRHTLSRRPPLTMSSNTPDASSVPENPAGEQQPSPPRRRGIYQYETTGSFWGDAAEAWKVRRVASCMRAGADGGRKRA